MQRVEIAYFMIVMMAAALAATIVYLRYHSRERTYHRRLKRERGEYARRMEAINRDADSVR